MRPWSGYPENDDAFLFRNLRQGGILCSSTVVLDLLRTLLPQMGSPKGHIIHLWSPSRSGAEQAGLSWVEAALPDTSYLRSCSGELIPHFVCHDFPLPMAGHHNFTSSVFLACILLIFVRMVLLLTKFSSSMLVHQSTNGEGAHAIVLLVCSSPDLCLHPGSAPCFLLWWPLALLHDFEFLSLER